MDHLLAYIQSTDISNLVAHCEQLELHFASETPADLTPTTGQSQGTQSSASTTSPTLTTAPAENRFFQLYPILLLAYLIDNDLSAARFLIKRVSPKIRQSFPNKDFETLVQVTNCLWQRNVQFAYPLLVVDDEGTGATAADGEDTAMNVEGEASTAEQHVWSTHLVPLVKRLAHEIRKRTLSLLGRAYESISASDATIYLGYGTPIESQEFVTNKGWRVEQDWLFPPAPGVASEGLSGSAQETKRKDVRDELAHLTAFVTQLGRS